MIRIVFGLCKDVVVIIIATNRHVSFPDIPKLDRLMMASHQIALLIWIIIHTQYSISTFLASLDNVFLAE